jgi:hypothetical protein
VTDHSADVRELLTAIYEALDVPRPSYTSAANVDSYDRFLIRRVEYVRGLLIAAARLTPATPVPDAAVTVDNLREIAARPLTYTPHSSSPETT